MLATTAEHRHRRLISRLSSFNQAVGWGTGTLRFVCVRLGWRGKQVLFVPGHLPNIACWNAQNLWHGAWNVDQQRLFLKPDVNLR